MLVTDSFRRVRNELQPRVLTPAAVCVESLRMRRSRQPETLLAFQFSLLWQVSTAPAQRAALRTTPAPATPDRSKTLPRALPPMITPPSLALVPTGGKIV